jgi:hypothetical protein
LSNKHRSSSSAAWLLSFGPEGRLLKSDWLVDEIKRSINGMKRNYRNKEQPSPE